MDFKSATDKLTESGAVNLTRVAEAFGITLNSVSRMRSGILRPPRNWEEKLAELAREAAEEMVEGAQDLREFADRIHEGG